MIGGVPDFADRAVAPSWRTAAVLGCALTVAGLIVMSPPAGADNKRLNDGVAVNVHTIHRRSEDVESTRSYNSPRNGTRMTYSITEHSTAIRVPTGLRCRTAPTRRVSRHRRRNRCDQPSARHQRHRDPQPVVLQPAYLAIMRDCTYTQWSGRRTAWTGRW